MTARLAWAGASTSGGSRGDVGADACVRVGTLQAVVPDAAGPLTLDLTLDGPVHTTNAYGWIVRRRDFIALAEAMGMRPPDGRPRRKIESSTQIFDGLRSGGCPGDQERPDVGRSPAPTAKGDDDALGPPPPPW